MGEIKKTKIEISKRFGWVVIKEKHTRMRKKHPSKAHNKDKDKLQTIYEKLMCVGKIETGT